MVTNFLETSHVRLRPEKTSQIKEEFNYVFYSVLLHSLFRLRGKDKEKERKKNEKQKENERK